jgi:hypothetical protein
MAETKADEEKGLLTFKLNGNPRLLAASEEIGSKSLFKQVQW